MALRYTNINKAMSNSKETDLRPSHIEVNKSTKYEMMIKITVLLLIVKLK